jgi:hypothetical protein
MDISIEELLDEARTMALELRIIGRQLKILQAQLETAKKETDEHSS